MYVCIMRQCFGVDTAYGSWLGLTIPAYGWDVTGRVPLVTKTRRCLREKLLCNQVANQACATSSRFLTRHNMGGDQSVGRPAKAYFNVQLKEISSRGLNRKKNSDPLPLYMHARSYQI
jgi:hypothetical protein